MLMSRLLFERLGGWDVGYRLHAEDLDLCRRARQVGATVAVVNTLQVVHLRGVSSRSRPFSSSGINIVGYGGTSVSSKCRSAGYRYV